MDMLKTVREIGFIETGCNLAHVLSSDDVKNKVGSVMPLPAPKLKDNMSEIADWLISFGKTKYMFLTPEIALVDELAERDGSQNVIFLLPCDMDTEMRERVCENVPKKMTVSILEEPYFPEAFYPGNGILIACGYIAAGRTMVLPETYRMIEHYGNFWGKKVFIPYVELENAVRYGGWMEIGNEKFSNIWRNE